MGFHTGSNTMKFSAISMSAALILGGASLAFAGDSEGCKFSDVGWTDITATTAIANDILTALGCTPKVTVLSVP
jgi:glycine betaine/proline transport system substrate-binding protein